MTVTITRVIAAAALLSASLVSEAPGVSAISIQHGSEIVHPFQRAAAHQEHARNRARADVPKRCPAKPTTTTSSKASTPTKPSSSGGSKDDGGDKGGDNGGSGNNGGDQSGSKPSWNAKKGLTWSNGRDDMLHYYVNSRVGIIYTWSASCPGEAWDLGLKCASMLWGYKNQDDFAKNSGKAPILMGPNEANLDDQANLSPGEAYNLWTKYIYWQKGKYLVTPSVTSATDGVSWMKEFFQICSDNGLPKFCGADAISLHFYGKSSQEAIDYVNNFRAEVGYPNVWLSEFSCQAFYGNDWNCDNNEIWEYMTGVTQWAEKTDWVTMYSPYGFMTNLGNVGAGNALMSSSGKPTDLGYWFLNN